MNETAVQTMERVLKELDKNESDWKIPEFLVRAWEWLWEHLSAITSNNVFFGFLILAALASLLIFLLYKFFRLFLGGGFFGKRSSFKRNKSFLGKPDSLPGGEAGEGSDRAMIEAGKMAAKGDFSGALIRLHRSSVTYLCERKLIDQKKNYTNREIRGQLGNHDLSVPFMNIAGEAEKILFNGENISKEQYGNLQRTYEDYFSEGEM